MLAFRVKGVLKRHHAVQFPHLPFSDCEEPQEGTVPSFKSDVILSCRLFIRAQAVQRPIDIP